MYQQGLGDIMNGDVTAAPDAVNEDATPAQKRTYAAERKEYDEENGMQHIMFEHAHVSKSNTSCDETTSTAWCTRTVSAEKVVGLVDFYYK